MNLLALFFYSFITIPYFVYYLKRNSITPVTLFLVFQMMMFYGICVSELGRTQSAFKLQYIYCVAIVFFILGVEFSKKYVILFSNKKKHALLSGSFEDHETSNYQLIVIWTIVGLSIVLCTLLFIRNGGNLFIEALKNFFENDTTSLSEARKNYTDVNGVGYIYQFRVVLLPLLSSFLLFFDKVKAPKTITIPVFIFMVVSLLGTGQRNAFVYYIIFMLTYSYIMRKDYGLEMISKTHMLFLGSFALIFLIILTISNGRVSNNDNLFLGAIDSLLNRVFMVNQESALVGFEYMDSQDTVWGYDWWKMFEQLLPGKSDYIPVDYISYRIVYGTLRGTNPPCLWGSAWYNFNIFGITVFPFVLGYCYEKLHKTTLRYINKDRLYVLVYSGLCTYLGIWTSGTPMVLFNNGVITLFILRWLCYKMPIYIDRINKDKH